VGYDDEGVPEKARTEKEGVRLIGADEAAEAMERDDTVARRRGGEPRYGDRPSSASADDQRPTIRFPLASEDAAALGSRPGATPRPADDPGMPHWTAPATGEVPRIFAAEDIGDEESGSWAGFSTGQPRWRGEAGGREGGFDDFSALGDDETRVGALASDDRPAPGDYFAFDDEDDWDDEAPEAAGDWFDEDEQPAATGRSTRTISSGPRRAAPVEGPPAAAGAGRDVPMAIGVGLAFAAVALFAFLLGPKFAVVLVTVVVVVAAAELFNVLRQAGYQPASLLGLAAVASLPLAAYYKGEVGIPVVLFLTVVFGLLWYLTGAGGDDRPVIGLSSTLFGVGWVGLLGSFAALMLVLPTTVDAVESPGIGILLVAIIGTVGYDIGGFAVGRNAGRRPLSAASPNKTVEGLAGGVVGAILLTVLASTFIAPFAEAGFAASLLLGVCVAVAAPLGDLCESLVKRDLDVKDMGAILPGHGGFLDRFDALLFVLPVVYYLARILLY
jgi:phosphatidate cytidylyltransferase